ncbi:hypothetical protein TREPR_3781 [Treponema primitia ZAS-2]|uniref:Uncharacterized protein n=1 Tax=Treponema primitia (strain ATCC BAA-887 / DSM 12427 / ZAS-2) TaxID=545694 RepID=F5YPR1_TREPZ|nr:hypothetical protein TREPR_3781 [Treponema primitia ZAS-2]
MNDSVTPKKTGKDKKITLSPFLVRLIRIGGLIIFILAACLFGFLISSRAAK